jgi:hypothetical protein
LTQIIATKNPGCGRKPAKNTALPMEQSGVVAAPSQFAAIAMSALPPGNQIEATLFDECRDAITGIHS